MSKLPLIVDQSEFRQASRVEKLQLVLREIQLEAWLSQPDFEYWQRLQQVFALTFKQFDQTKAIRVIRNQVPGAERYEVARRLYEDMASVYGPFMKRNKDLARAILIQRLWSIGVRLEQQGLLVEAAEAFEKAGKFEGLDKHEHFELDPDDIKLPEIHITNDPRYANAEEAEIVEDNEEGEDGLL